MVGCKKNQNSEAGTCQTGSCASTVACLEGQWNTSAAAFFYFSFLSCLCSFLLFFLPANLLCFFHTGGRTGGYGCGEIRYNRDMKEGGERNVVGGTFERGR